LYRCPHRQALAGGVRLCGCGVNEVWLTPIESIGRVPRRFHHSESLISVGGMIIIASSLIGLDSKFWLEDGFWGKVFSLCEGFVSNKCRFFLSILNLNNYLFFWIEFVFVIFEQFPSFNRDGGGGFQATNGPDTEWTGAPSGRRSLTLPSAATSSSPACSPFSHSSYTPTNDGDGVVLAISFFKLFPPHPNLDHS